jgi:hypothetical protein
MSRHTKDRRKQQKERLQVAVKQEKIVFDVLNLIRTEQIDTKPNMGKFLKQYVKGIRGVNASGKMTFYPSVEYRTTKVIVQFMDEHDFVFNGEAEKPEDRYYCSFGVDEVKLKQKDYEYLERFFDLLRKFGFFYDSPPS